MIFPTSMFSKQYINLKKLFEKVPENYLADFNRKTVYDNFMKMRLLNFGLCIWISIMLFMDIVFKENVNKVEGYENFLLIDIILCVLIYAFTLFCHLKTPGTKEETNRLHKSLIVMNSIFVLFGSCVISAVEHNATSNIPTYIIAVFIVGTIYHFRFIYLLSLYILSCLFILAILFYQGFNIERIIVENYSFIGLIGFAMLNARILAYNRKRSFINEMKLSEANILLHKEIKEKELIEKELAKANTDLEKRVLERTKALMEVNKKMEKTIHERLIATDKIKASLREKDILLQEIHHRVKNNLQVVQSLLSLQSRFIQDPKTMSVFQESINRIRSMAIVHETLYESRDFSSINMNQYIRKLAVNLQRTYSDTKSPTFFEYQIRRIFLPIDLAVPCGLIVNELVTNTMKYAFPTNWKNKKIVQIILTKEKDGYFRLIVQDNGQGFKAPVNIDNPKTLGLQLVYLLSTEQLGGKMKIDTAHNTRFDIRFPLKHPAERKSFSN